MEHSFEPSLALCDIAAVFSALGFEYFLVGSFASGFRGEFRATNDIDIVVRFDERRCAEFCELAKVKFYCDEMALKNAVRERRSFNLIHEPTFIKIDIFTRTSEFEQEQFSLSTPLLIPGTGAKAFISTVEYNIIAKLVWYFKSNKVLTRQLQDVASMIRINFASLNHSYLDRWAVHFGVKELLDQLLREEEERER